MKIFIIIPAYNEEERVGQVLDQLSLVYKNIVVVDDNSTDKTREIIKKYQVHYLKHVINCGQGAALKTGTEFAVNQGADYIVHFDADGQHRLEDLVNLIKTLKREDHDIVLGSRFLGVKAVNMPFAKKMILKGGKVFNRLFFNVKLTDPQNGLRGFKSEIFEKLDFKAPGFEHASEILGLIFKNNLNYKEIPIQVNYDNYTKGKQVKPQALVIALRLLVKKILGTRDL